MQSYKFPARLFTFENIPTVGVGTTFEPTGTGMPSVFIISLYFLSFWVTFVMLCSIPLSYFCTEKYLCLRWDQTKVGLIKMAGSVWRYALYPSAIETSMLQVCSCLLKCRIYLPNNLAIQQKGRSFYKIKWKIYKAT